MEFLKKQTPHTDWSLVFPNSNPIGEAKHSLVYFVEWSFGSSCLIYGLIALWFLVLSELLGLGETHIISLVYWVTSWLLPREKAAAHTHSCVYTISEFLYKHQKGKIAGHVAHVHMGLWEAANLYSKGLPLPSVSGRFLCSRPPRCLQVMLQLAVFSVVFTGKIGLSTFS